MSENEQSSSNQVTNQPAPYNSVPRGIGGYPQNMTNQPRQFMPQNHSAAAYPFPPVMPPMMYQGQYYNTMRPVQGQGRGTPFMQMQPAYGMPPYDMNGVPHNMPPPGMVYMDARRLQGMMTGTMAPGGCPMPPHHMQAMNPQFRYKYLPPPHLLHGMMKSSNPPEITEQMMNQTNNLGPNGTNSRSSNLKCPSQLRNGRPLFMELLYLCNTIYSTYNMSEQPITPVTPLKLASGTKKIFVRSGSIRVLPFDTISPIHRLLGIQNLKWLPCRIAYPRATGDTIQFSSSTENDDDSQKVEDRSVPFPSFPKPLIGRASCFIDGPIQKPETPNSIGCPVDPSDIRWKYPLWSFYSHLSHEDAEPLALALITCLDDLTFSRLRMTGQETRKWLDHWYTCWSNRHSLMPPDQSRKAPSPLLSSCILWSDSFSDLVPWIKLKDLELFENIKNVGGSKATQTSYVQQFKAPSANFVRMCIATLEPGGVFSMVPMDGGAENSSSSSQSTQQSVPSRNSVETKQERDEGEPVLCVSDESIYQMRSNGSLFPDISFDDTNIWKSWIPNSCSGAMVLRLYNCWRLSVTRIVSIYRRKVFTLWYQHDMIHHEKASKAQAPNKVVDQLQATADTLATTFDQLANRDQQFEQESKSTACCENPTMPSRLGSTWIDWFSHYPEDSTNLPETLLASQRNNISNQQLNNHIYLNLPHMSNHRRAESKRKQDRRNERDLSRQSLQAAYENLYKQLTDDLSSPYIRANSTPADFKKDIIIQSIIAHQQRIEWDIICLLSLYIQLIEQPNRTVNDSLMAKIESMICQLKVDRFMVLVLQCRMNNTKHLIKGEFDPTHYSIEEVIKGDRYRPKISVNPLETSKSTSPIIQRKRPANSNESMAASSLRSWAIRRFKVAKSNKADNIKKRREA